MSHSTEPLIPGSLYHIYNRANGSEKLFLSDDNYRFFLKRYKDIVAPFVDTYAYCLMPNHFHLLIRVKETSTFSKVQNFGKGAASLPEKFISKQFSNFFSSYTQAFNKQQNRMGSLFMKNFKRKRITDERYLKTLIVYIHNNPVQAVLSRTPESWYYSSFREISRQYSQRINLDAVMAYFDSLEHFYAFHNLNFKTAPTVDLDFR